jgi:hypothetical protein
LTIVVEQEGDKEEESSAPPSTAAQTKPVQHAMSFLDSPESRKQYQRYLKQFFCLLL